MRPSKVTIIICSCFLISISIAISKFLFFMNTLDTEVNYVPRNVTSRYSALGKSSENLMWMIQISDLHLSIFHEPSRITELREFCNTTIDIIKPSVVLATGDLTDAKTLDGEGSTQFEEEWITYRDVLYRADVPRKLLWLDIRGNHDNFDVLCLNSDNNYYRKYSIQGPEHPRSYFYVHKMNNSEKIGFLGVDSCLEVGTKRPFNFVGQLTSTEMESINSFLDESRSVNVNYLMWFGHYPTSTIKYPESERLRELIANDERSVAYFCGHLHQIGGLVPQMYTFQKEGYFELELGDWKGNRIIRLMAIDHGQFSFVDVKHGTWPIVLVTNPKTVILVPPGGKPVVPPSSHIRMLIFSSTPITLVQLRIDNRTRQRCDHVGGPLYVSQWNETEFDKGLHTIVVEVVDETGHTATYQHEFSLDGTRVKTKFLPRLFLMPNLGLLFYCLFTCSVVACSMPLLVFRCMMKRNSVNAAYLANVQSRCIVRWIRRLCILTYQDVFFYPLFCYPIYLFAGPWAIVYLVENNLGVIFSWGLIMNGTFIPSWITYPFGWVQTILHAFLISHLAACLDRRCYSIVNKMERVHPRRSIRTLHFCWTNKCYLFVILIQAWDTYNFWLSYGHPTLIFCPLKTWWIIMAVWLKRKVYTLQREKLLNLNRVWHSS